ncbi:MAG: type II secretion system minor pseudopilin GspK [Gammaproteobacteria bacterium]|nr:type II secretion system minor pseudopilin GspK [Gammaproteobacteria bacterium]
MTLISPFPRKRKTGGVALVTVLLIVSIATVLVVSMTSKQYFSIRAQGNMQANVQAWQYVISLEQWATVVLNRDARENKTDSINDAWQLGIPETKVGQAFITAQISDLQGRLNVNNLIKNNELSQTDYQVFQRLFSELGVDASILNAIVDWIDADSEPSYPGGAEDDYYMAQKPGMRSANQSVFELEELLDINGMTIDVFNTLIPHISALPGYRVVNVNTATDKVLIALTKGLTQGDADNLIAYREGQVIDNIKEWHKLPQFASREVDASLVGTDSDFFGLDNFVKTDKYILTVFTALYRENGVTRVQYRQKRGY